MTAAETLRVLRGRAGQTQAEAAGVVYVDARTWRRWERGEREPPRMVLHLYAILTGQPWPQ